MASPAQNFDAQREPPVPRPFVSNVALILGRRAIAWLIIAIVASLALAVIELGVSLFLQLFLKGLGLLDHSVETTSLLAGVPMSPSAFALGLCLLAIARSSAFFLMAQSGSVSTEMVVARLRRIAIWEALLHPSRRFVPAAEINARVGNLADKSAQFAHFGTGLIAASVQAVALAAVMFATASGETLIALGGLAVVGLFVLRVNRHTRAVANDIPRELRVLTRGVERIARNTTLVRVLRTEQVEYGRLVKSIDSYASYLTRSSSWANFASAIAPFAGILLIVAIVGTSQSLTRIPSITLLSFLYLFVRFVQMSSSAALAFSSCSTVWPPFKDSVDYVSRFRPEDVDAATVREGAPVHHADPFTREEGGEAPTIELRSLDFGYPGSSSPVLHGLSLKIERGTQLGIVGPSGCGKSTLLALVLGVLEPTSGEVLVDGQVATHYFRHPTRRIGYVGAEAFLIAGSIRENLQYGLATSATEDDLWRALEEAQLRSTVEGLPGKLEYMLLEDGSGLSAGQKQRLCLARALLVRPQVLVLDEVSANLDAETERLVALSLRALRGRCTILIASHRRGILADADRLISLE